jgi:hypothetical protein
MLAYSQQEKGIVPFVVVRLRSAINIVSAAMDD